MLKYPKAQKELQAKLKLQLTEGLTGFVSEAVRESGTIRPPLAQKHLVQGLV